MNNDEFRTLYCWLIESVRPSKEVVAQVLRNILNALEEKQRKCNQKRVAQTKEKGRITQNQSNY